MIKVIPLRDAPEYIGELATWLHQEFSCYNPGETLSGRVEKLKKRSQIDQIPLCLIATENGELRGTASLIECDMDIRSELTPWLASVYVHPPFRGKGVATVLINEISRVAKDLGHSSVYLFTPDQQKLYERNGWKRYENLEYSGKVVDLMKKEL